MDRRKVLVVGKEGVFSRELIDCAVHLAERLDFDIIALNVGNERGGEVFEMLARKAANALRRKAEGRGIHCEHVIRYGAPGSAVEEVNHGARRIELVIIDAGIDREEVAREVTVPLFGVVTGSSHHEGGKDMAGNQGNRGKRVLGSTIGFGLLSAALYAAVFMHADTVMQYFTRGGWYAALPVATVFLFSFAHGAFASNLWSLMGIEAMKKGAVAQVKREVVQSRKQVQKRPRTYAYVNPFHRIDR